MSNKIFVNLPVKDLKKTMEFFGNLGFQFNPMFTDENAACMVISEDNYAMLLTEKFFKNFIPGREICDSSKSTESLVALSLESRARVDEMIKKAVAAGGAEYRRRRTMAGCTAARSRTSTGTSGSLFTWTWTRRRRR